MGGITPVNGNNFVFRESVGWVDTIKTLFIPKQTIPKEVSNTDPTAQQCYLSQRKTAIIGKASGLLLAIGVIIGTIAIAAILCPPVGLFVLSLLPLTLLALKVIGGASALVGVISLTVASAAIDKLRHGTVEKKFELFDDGYDTDDCLDDARELLR